MVDFRPLLFINALALMLLVTAGFASVRDDLRMTETFEPPAVEQVITSRPDESEISAPPAPSAIAPPLPEPAPQQSNTPVVDATPFTIPPMPENPEVLAVAEPPAAMATRTDTAKATRENRQNNSSQSDQRRLCWCSAPMWSAIR